MKAALLTWTGVLAASALVAGGAALAPDALRRVDEFHVARVVVHGAVNLDPHEVLAASGITPTTSVFDDADSWRDALLAHPLVRTAHFERELPATLHVHVTETTPLALVQTPELRVADARGNVLPVRAEAEDLDLPIVLWRSQIAAAETSAAPGVRSYLRASDEPTLRVLALLESLERLDAELLALVSEAAPIGRSDVQLRLRAPEGLIVVLAPPLELERLRAVRLTLAHLGGADAASLRVRIDARYDGQIVVAPVTRTQANQMNRGAR